MRAKTPKGDSKSKFGHNINSSLNLNKKKEDILNKIINKLEDIVSDYVAQKDAGKVIKQIKALVISLYKHKDQKHSLKDVSPMIPINTTISVNQDVNNEHLKEINKNDLSHNSSVISDISTGSQPQKDTASQNLRNIITQTSIKMEAYMKEKWKMEKEKEQVKWHIKMAMYI